MSSLFFVGVVVVGLIALVVALVVDVRTSPEQEAERIKRQDEAMKTKDDPNEPARFVP